MTAVIADLRSALRTLAAARGFTAIAVVTLSAGLTLCVTVLTVVNAYVIRALPYPAADRLYRVDYAVPGQSSPRGLDTLDWASLNDVIEFPISWDLDVFYLLGGEYPESAPGAWVTPGYMQGLGVPTAIGRVFDAADYQQSSPAVAIISHRLWQTRFGGDPAIVGRSFQAYVSDRPEEPETFTIVGVLPARLWHLNSYTEVLAPLKAASYPYMARLHAGVPAQVAADRITALVRGGVSTVPDGWRTIVTSSQASYIATVRPMLWSVGTAAALVLLIAGANVAVLLLVRGRRRQKELAVRLALGASHARLGRLLALEGLVLGVIATVTGIAASRLAMQSLAPLVERFLERRAPGGLEAFALDDRVILAASACGLLITLVFTLVPLIATWKASLAPHLSSVGRATTEGSGSRRTQSLLIGIEVAASLTLLAGAALMGESALRMLRVDFGIDPEDVFSASLSLRQRSYPDAETRALFYERVSSRLAGVAGSTSIAIGDWWPLQAARPRRVESGGPQAVATNASIFGVNGEYFATLGIRLQEGRTFAAHDRLGSVPVVIVSEALAERLWPQSGAVGQRLTLHPEGEAPLGSHLVVGIVNNVRQTHLDSDLFDAYLPLSQRAGRFAFLYTRSPRSPTWESDLRLEVAAIDREVALGVPRSLEAGLDQERAKPRFLAFLLSGFAVFASVLSLVGMHGVIAYAVGQRQREIAIRMTMGANPRSVTGLFLRQGSALLVGGLVGGIAGAVALGRVLQSQLHGVQASDPGILAGSAVAFAVCGLLAIWWPAWRAAATDPALVLKEP